MNLTITRLIGILAALAAGLTAFTGAVTSSGGYKGAIVAAFSAVVLTWIHEEHSTDRNATTAASTMTAPAPAQMHPADMAAATQAVAGLLGGAPPASSSPPAPTHPAAAQTA